MELNYISLCCLTILCLIMVDEQLLTFVCKVQENSDIEIFETLESNLKINSPEK